MEMRKNMRFLNEDKLFDIILESQFSVDMISEEIYEDVIRELKYNKNLTVEPLFLARVNTYYEKSIELLKVGDLLHSFTIILGIYELRLMEIPDISKDYLDSISFQYLDFYSYKIDRNLSVKNKQILIELLLMEYEKYEYEPNNIFDFEDFIRILERIVIDKNITAYFIKMIENKVLYKLEKKDYVVGLKEKLYTPQS